ncbi:MAG: hypothetical protein FWB95_06210 [Treponema sp.]|nr:hypothetical protein [Treponema sp.]
MSEFKKCSQGHVYESGLEECPYCNGKNVDDELEKLPKKPEINKDILKDMADCYMRGPSDF